MSFRGSIANTVFKAMTEPHAKIADAASIKTCRVRCDKCGREQDADGAECLAHGWPLCCGQTMRLLTDGGR